jgi:BirA family biotin operon repressor/biotin-[acetyl-CoA-carboxylase] ligase
VDGAVLTGEQVPLPCGSLRLEQVGEIGSTSDALKARAADTAHGEVALLARIQTGGHGRLGRSWRSVDGNLSLSVLLRPRSLRWPGHWSILSAVALADAVRPYLPDPRSLRLKWPNDLLLNGGKLAGILLEAGFTDPPWLVIGFGVNLAGVPEDLGRQTACLADLAPPPAPKEFGVRLLDTLQRWRKRYDRDGFAPVQAAWLAMAHTPGDIVTADVGARRVQGAFRGLGPDGALLLDDLDGLGGGVVSVSAGELA